MRTTLALCCILLLFPQRQCTVASPDKLKEATETRLRGYFPNVKAVLLPAKETIVAVTCTQGIGADLLPKFQQSIAQDQELNRELPWLQLGVQAVGGVHYRYLLLYFDSGMIQYDLDAKQISVIGLTDQQLQLYRTKCGISAISTDQ